MRPGLVKFQIGKNGVTLGVVESLQLALKNHSQVRISILKSACRDREGLEKLVLDLKEKMPIKCFYRIIGFTIILKKQSNK